MKLACLGYCFITYNQPWHFMDVYCRILTFFMDLRAFSILPLRLNLVISSKGNHGNSHMQTKSKFPRPLDCRDLEASQGLEAKIVKLSFDI
jgi:hypothetical protein